VSFKVLAQGGDKRLCAAEYVGSICDLRPAYELGRAKAVKQLLQEFTRATFKLCELNSHAEGGDAAAYLAEGGNLVVVNVQKETELGACRLRHGSAEIAAAKAQVAQLGPDVLAGFRPAHLHIPMAAKTRVLPAIVASRG
jgi:hypothetical protein